MKKTTKLLLKSLKGNIEIVERLAKAFDFEMLLDTEDKLILKSKKDTYIIEVVLYKNRYYWNVYCKNPFAYKFKSTSLLELFKSIIFKDHYDD